MGLWEPPPQVLGRPPYWREGGCGVSSGEKGAVAAPSCREVHQEGKKSEREGKKP